MASNLWVSLGAPCFPDAWKTEQVTQAKPQPTIDLQPEPTAVNNATAALDVQPQAAVKPLAATVPNQTAPNQIPSNLQVTPSTEINQRSQPLSATAESESLAPLSNWHANCEFLQNALFLEI